VKNLTWQTADPLHKQVVGYLKSLEDTGKLQEYSFKHNNCLITIYFTFDREYREEAGGEPDEVLLETVKDIVSIEWYDVEDAEGNEVDDCDFETEMDSLEALYNNTKL